jgi:phosphopantothenoylcysteine decarboxylase/phosphopantothenate--cysteine ligase
MAAIRCLVSAVPTREHFDPVRFISNPSSGKMGYAIARAAAEAGWEVTLVSGPVSLPAPAGVELVPVVSAAEMLKAVDGRFDDCDILIMTAAVSDYRPKVVEPRKMKKGAASLVVELEPTVDILRHVASRKKPGQYVVGFAAETNDVEAYALGKMKAKNCDMMVANQVGVSGSGFAGDHNSVVLLWPDAGREAIGPSAKESLARDIVARIASRYLAERA